MLVCRVNSLCRHFFTFPSIQHCFSVFYLFLKLIFFCWPTADPGPQDCDLTLWSHTEHAHSPVSSFLPFVSLPCSPPFFIWSLLYSPGCPRLHPTSAFVPIWCSSLLLFHPALNIHLKELYCHWKNIIPTKIIRLNTIYIYCACCSALLDTCFPQKYRGFPPFTGGWLCLTQISFSWLHRPPASVS